MRWYRRPRLCFVMHNNSSGHSGGGGQPSILIWKSVISATPKIDSKCEDEGGHIRIHISDKIDCFFCAIWFQFLLHGYAFLTKDNGKVILTKEKWLILRQSKDSFLKKSLHFFLISSCYVLIQEKNLWPWAWTTYVISKLCTGECTSSYISISGTESRRAYINVHAEDVQARTTFDDVFRYGPLG